MNFNTKYIIIVFLSLLLATCAMENRSVESKTKDFLNVDEASTEEYIGAKTITHKILINQKLQDFYDLLALHNQYPEFKNNVELQLKNFTLDSLNNYNYSELAEIKNIRQIGNAIFIDNNTQKIKLQFDIITKEQKITDTIFSIITTKAVIVDNDSLISNKAIFSKN